jgi:outer membrane murein-binding lipoprotein Lpp
MAQKTGLQNETLISELLVSGSSAITTKNSFGVHTFEQTSDTDGVISGKLVKPKYNESELVKSIDTVIFELLPVAPPPIDDRIPRPIYNQVTQSVIDLTAQVEELTTEVFTLRAKVQDVEIVSESLKVQLDLKDLNVASFQNQSSQLTSKVTNTITELQNSIQKGTLEAIQRVSLYARNQSLEQELSALREAVSAKEQALAAGAVSTGQLASILFDGAGDPTKSPVDGIMICMDYGGGYGSTASTGKFAPSGNTLKTTFRSSFEIIASSALAGGKQIEVDIKFSGGKMTQSPFDWGFTLPVKIKGGEKKKFDMSKPSTFLGTIPGQHGGGLFSHSKETVYDYSMTITLTSEGVTENKEFKMRLYHHG